MNKIICSVKVTHGWLAEQKLPNKNCRTKTAEQKLVGNLGHWVMCKCKKVRGTKAVEQNWWGPSGTPSASAKRSVEQKPWNKNRIIKIAGDPWGPQVQVYKGQGKNWWGPWGPQVQVQKGHGTKTAERKYQNKNQQNKNCWETLRYWLMEVPSASAIRSAEQNYGTKTVEQNWYGQCKNVIME